MARYTPVSSKQMMKTQMIHRNKIQRVKEENHIKRGLSVFMIVAVHVLRNMANKDDSFRFTADDADAFLNETQKVLAGLDDVQADGTPFYSFDDIVASVEEETGISLVEVEIH